MKKISFFLTAVSLTVSTLLHAEIEKVVIKWTPQLCTDSCVKGIYHYMKGVDSIAEIKVNKEAGQADIRWKPQASFSYFTVNQPMQMVGLYVKDMRLRVRGTIVQTKMNMKLISLGDNTSFTLLSPIQPSGVNMPQVNNPESHYLMPEVRQKLLDAEANHQVVTIEGPLFEGWRSPPLLLIVEQLHISKPPSDQGEGSNKG